MKVEVVMAEMSSSFPRPTNSTRRRALTLEVGSSGYVIQRDVEALPRKGMLSGRWRGMSKKRKKMMIVTDDHFGDKR
jgi:hypothetical protein